MDYGRMDLQLTGKRAIVTGGSSGIGWAIARQLAKEGVDVAVCSRSLDRAGAAIDEMGLTEGGRLLPVEVQLKDDASVQAMVAKVVDELGGVDILVNSGAEVAGNVAEDFDHITDEFILGGFEDKFIGIMRMCRAVVPHMKASGWGRIINMAGSKARVAGSIGAGARNTAVTHLTKDLSNEFGRYGINVTGIGPFTTVTKGYESRVANMAAQRGLTVEEHMERISARTAIGRLVTAEEIAYFAAFLASPLSVSLTGEVLALTGGLGDAVYL
jgi:NAD(P)-dependent dehydrogenase (short-subunit alcohol dehydrogenase family)